MTVAATAKRRRRQAVMGYRHLARLGRGNNNRSYFPHHTRETLERRAAEAAEKRIAMQSRKRRGK